MFNTGVIASPEYFQSLVEPADMDPIGEGHWLHVYNARGKISLITI